MRSYEEISNRIMKRGDEIIESRRVRAVKIKHTSYAVSGMCAAVIAGVGIWRIAPSMEPGGEKYSGSELVTDTEASAMATTTAHTSPAAVTTSDTTKEMTTTAPITQTTAVESNSADKTSAQTEAATAASQTTRRTVTTRTTTTAAVTTTTQVTTGTEETTESVTTVHGSPVSTMDQTPGRKYHELVLKDASESARPGSSEGDELFTYRAFHMDNSILGQRLRSDHVKTEYRDNGELISEETDIEVYTVKDISPVAVIAVKFKGYTGNYIYVSNSYQPADLRTMINNLSMTADGLSEQVNISNKRYDNVNTQKLWELLAEDIYIPNSYYQCQDIRESIIPKLTVSYRLPRLKLIGGYISISEDGYMVMDICGLPSYFYIGEARAQELIDYITSGETS
ncbi:hypothetical protein [Ruminococcus flavefaciens]|uniref:Uncharacterized protein n=1 Tax=Ruminococcus flavefaciens 007c TaxID=1341157 RepID=W7UUV6_RUMFL|nr:hypothetical protein [Ruminococcus flavefaciens]EWM52595.1 hypothetical protein RF007C_00505 [Ruminococcus flavefaciens 007c]